MVESLRVGFATRKILHTLAVTGDFGTSFRHQRADDAAELAAPGKPAVHAARRRWEYVAHPAPRRLRGEELGGQPARPPLPRPDGAGALHAGPEEAQGVVHGGDAHHPRREAR